MKPIYLYVTPFFPSPTDWRGAYCYDFVRALIKTGKYEVRVFKPGGGSDYEYQGVKVHTFSTRQLPSNVFPFLSAGSKQRSFLRKVSEVAGREEWGIADVAVCHGNTATFSPYPLAVKAVNPKCLTLLHHHDPGSFGLQSGRLRHCWLYNMIQFPILRKWHERIDCHVFISELVKRNFLMAPKVKSWVCASYRKQMRGLPWRPVCIKDSVVLYNGVDEERFKNAGRMPASGVLTIGCVGNFTREKGQLMLLEAVNLLSHHGVAVRVRFVGSGGNIDECRRFAKENQLQVEFLTEMDHTQLPDFYRELDLFVLPSVWDGFGCVYTEAWACGTPFITTSGAGAAELVPKEDWKYWVCEEWTAEELAAKIDDFKKTCREQKLTGAVGIDALVADFVEKLKIAGENPIYGE